MSTPMVSVVMPVYNASQYLKESIESILHQTYTNFEFIILDDASTDNSLAIISSYNDKRIILVKNETNKGITQTLNIGLSISKGKYIARMDADDISLPYRLEKQVQFLENNFEYGLVGGYMQLMPTEKIVTVPNDDESLRVHMLFHNPFVHPSIMIRKSILDNFRLKYDETLPAAQDEDLWFSIAKYAKISNLPEVLIKYRIHQNQISIAKRKIQIESSRQVKIRKALYFFPSIPNFDPSLYGKWIFSEEEDNFTLDDFQRIQEWSYYIIKQNKKIRKLNSQLLKIHITNLIIKIYSQVNVKVNLCLKFKVLYFFLRIGRLPIRFLFHIFFTTFKSF
ncbi:MAG: glycosyltransferase [Bacteroidales bacterium]|nr:glycosyltransferase [Bacteroidales bacterium]